MPPDDRPKEANGYCTTCGSKQPKRRKTKTPPLPERIAKLQAEKARLEKKLAIVMNKLAKLGVKP